jgi:hypothetical protein
MPAASQFLRKRTTSTSTSVTWSRSNTVLGLLPSNYAHKASRCAACGWPIRRSVVWCPSTCRALLPVICAASGLSSVRLTTGDHRSYRKNDTTPKLLIHLH